MNKLEYLISLNPDFLELKTQEIVDDDEVIGYHCFAVDKSQFTFSGGTSNRPETAKRIAIAEAFERSLLSKIARNHSSRKDFLINENPSSSGFAAGFNPDQTSFRALCEGLECWAWSKWIDEGFKLIQVEQPQNISKLTHYFLASFQKVYWFTRSFEVVSDGKKIVLEFAVFLGCTEEGIFSGSRVSTLKDDLWEHPVVEAYRNYKNFLFYSKNKYELTDIIQERVIFFAQNKQIALDQINRATIEHWPLPEIILLKDYKTDHPEVFLFRCLFKDFIGWHEGDVTRFVY